MMKTPSFIQKIGLIGLIVIFCGSFSSEPSVSLSDKESDDFEILKEIIITEFRDEVPHQWGENVSGVKTMLDTEDRVVAITLDACGSEGDGYDSELIDYLVAKNIPATLFLSGKWIDKNKKTFKALAKQPLFEIENHGLNHKPCSVTGKSAYGIEGTKNSEEVFYEMEKNARKIEEVTGRLPDLYRSGTAHYDEVAVRIAEALGYDVVGFNILGDKGASYTKEEVSKALLNAVPGSIAIFHMNHPEGDTAEGLMSAIPKLKRKGFQFVKLSEYSLK